MSRKSIFTVGGTEVAFGAGQIVAVPIGMEHGLRNERTRARRKLLTFFTPPLALWSGAVNIARQMSFTDDPFSIAMPSHIIDSIFFEDLYGTARMRAVFDANPPCSKNGWMSKSWLAHVKRNLISFRQVQHKKSLRRPRRKFGYSADQRVD